MSPDMRQRGFGVIAAIFILVILATLAGFIVSLSAQQQVGSALDVLGARAYQAARSGTEWGLYRLLKDGSCVASTDIGALDGMSVTVTCTVGASTEPGTTLYTLVSTACNMPNTQQNTDDCPGVAASVASLTYVERRVSVLAEH